MYQVFTKDTNHLVLPDAECSFETLENVSHAGFQLVWDSAPTEFEGAQYAAREYGACVPVQKVYAE